MEKHHSNRRSHICPHQHNAEARDSKGCGSRTTLDTLLCTHVEEREHTLFELAEYDIVTGIVSGGIGLDSPEAARHTTKKWPERKMLEGKHARGEHFNNRQRCDRIDEPTPQGLNESIQIVVHVEICSRPCTQPQQTQER